ncbi:phosphoglycerate dehydrogenase [Marinicella sp. S1101]|uniref:phosphoglycerate dehydrogenase n=1 Tax=Marinicella marina TaxID=2996016 RepID=UPI002260F115|nr:phosphoglycerate dehydrogenase [Marinicella marina]MCX7553816.1 phosphoglycerate dehydrogenase [Marinicella marina]MDJ1140892.1 phosphoglycerate dehydrogenase [Marinicella marina]
MAKLSLSKEKIKVVLLEGVHPDAEKLFKADGYDNIHVYNSTPEDDELQEILKDTHILGIRSRTQLKGQNLATCDKLMAVGTFCIGTNQVDLDQCKIQGIPVFNAPFSNTRSVAELVMGEIILLLRGIPEKNAKAHRGEWFKSAINSNETRGKTLGIVGFGHIGSQLCVLAEAMGMKVKYYDIENKLPLGNSEAMPSLEALLPAVDVLSLHVPDTELTRQMIGAKELALLPQGAFLINAARGHIVVIDDLVDALESQHLNGAALDVYPEEPASNQHPFETPLLNFDNVILTPHIGGSTQEAQFNIANEVADKLIKYSNNGSTSSAVNFPEVSLPALHDDLTRVMHIHQNKPGMLERINHAFSSQDINIAAMYLQTSGDVGYVIMDVNCESSDPIVAQLKDIDGTIRVRVLH